jgi:hypothetical protein
VNQVFPRLRNLHEDARHHLVRIEPLDLVFGSFVIGSRLRSKSDFSEIGIELQPHDEPDAVLVRLDFAVTRDGAPARLRYEIIDELDPRTGLSAMMRTTAFPASIVAQMMASGETFARGALPQERCIPPDPFVEELAKREIELRVDG